MSHPAYFFVCEGVPGGIEAFDEVLVCGVLAELCEDGEGVVDVSRAVWADAVSVLVCGAALFAAGYCAGGAH